MMQRYEIPDIITLIFDIATLKFDILLYLYIIIKSETFLLKGFILRIRTMADCARLWHKHQGGRMGRPPPTARLRSKVAFPKNFLFFYFLFCGYLCKKF